MKISSRQVVAVSVFVVLFASAVFFLKQRIGPVSIPPKIDVVKTVPLVVANASTDSITPHLTVPDGFAIHVFADNVPGARVLAFDAQGRVLVSETEGGKIVILDDTNHDGVADTNKILASKLNKPHGLAFDCPIDDRGLPCFLYVAQRGELGRYVYDAKTATVSSYKKLAALETSLTDRHFTRTLLFLPSPNDHILLVSVGSSCNVCHEEGEMRGKIMAYDTKTGTLTEYARGLRNAVFMTLNPVSGEVFSTEMGRDGLGDDIPPDEIDKIEQGKNYGWPNCYGKNIHDDAFDKNTYIRNPCMAPFETPSFIDLQAHFAPLGLAFVPEEGWPEAYWNNLLVAFHGSWNRTQPTGYKIMRLKLDAKGNYAGAEDFISGWLTPDGKKLGRPVDIKVFSGGIAYISDDSSGMIYRLTRQK